MADRKPTDLNELGEALTDSDIFEGVNTSDTTDDSAGTSVKILASRIKTYIEALPSFFNVSSDDSDDITQGSTNLFMTSAERTKLSGVETSATADQSDAEIETAYNNQVSQISSGEKTAGTGTSVRRFAPQDVHDMIDTHGGSGGSAIEVEDEGSSLTTAVTKFNFVGSGVSATESSDEVTVTVAGGSAPVDSVNSQTGAVVLDADDIDDSSTTHRFATAAQLTKVDTVETNADVTDTANVTSAGALMDSELASEADVKALDQSVVSGASPTFTATNITGFAAGAIDAITELASGLKSGSDATLVTGTAGTADNLSKWNADGDLVDAGFSITTGTPAKGSLLIGDGASDYDEVAAGTNDQVVVYDSAQTNGVKKVDLDVVINVALDGGGSAIADGTEFILNDLPAFTITQVTLTGDVSGSITVDIDVDSYSNYPPTGADSITASATPALSSAQKYQDGTLTGWSTSVTDGSSMRIYADGAATSITRAYLTIRGTRNF